MHNYEAALFGQGAAEIGRCCAARRSARDRLGLAGVGDMYVTSPGGRNVRVGGCWAPDCPSRRHAKRGPHARGRGRDPGDRQRPAQAHRARPRGTVGFPAPAASLRGDRQERAPRHPLELAVRAASRASAPATGHAGLSGRQKPCRSRKRVTALCLPSGRRLGPYCVSRWAASPASRPLARSVPSPLPTSSAAIACRHCNQCAARFRLRLPSLNRPRASLAGRRIPTLRGRA